MQGTLIFGTIDSYAYITISSSEKKRKAVVALTHVVDGSKPETSGGGGEAKARRSGVSGWQPSGRRVVALRLKVFKSL